MRSKLFRHEQPVTSIGIGEPSITLVENDEFAFSVLMADGAHEDSFTSRLYLDRVTLLRVRNKAWTFQDFDCVEIFAENGVWKAKDRATDLYFHQPSTVPYHTIFISRKQFRDLLGYKHVNLAKPIFKYSQDQFGSLPNFDTAGNMLIAAPGYAEAREILKPEQFLMPK